MIKNIDLKNLDKSSWKTFRFDEIAQKISERVKPDKTDLKIYVGLEHLDPESVHIKRRGMPADVKGEKLKCYPGDVIFGKRRAYQRKAAIATFEGICSGHSFVFRANPAVIDPKLFPFFLHSDQFMHRMIDISVGGLSPTINWGNLKEQEFLLPPKEQQVQLTELLWAMDEVVEKNRAVLKKLHLTKDAFQRLYYDLKDQNRIPLGEIATIYSGGTPNRKKEEYWKGDIPWIKTAEVNYNIIKKTEEYITDEGLRKSAAKLIPKNSILVAMYGQGVTRGRVAVTGINATCNQACGVIELHEGFNYMHVYNFLEYKYEDLRSLAHGANQKNLNLGMIKEFEVPNINIDKQLDQTSIFNYINQSLIKTKTTINSSQSLQKSLINQIF